MAITFKFYIDSGLVTELSGNLIVEQADDGSSGPVDNVLYLGSIDTARKVQANSNPGVDLITLSVIDASIGVGHPATEIKLATTQVGLDSAVGGADLDLGVEVLGGSGNAQPIWIRVEDSTGTIGTSTELSVRTEELREVDI